MSSLPAVFGLPLNVSDIDTLDFAKADGLIPAVVQHAQTGAVLMVGYMNRQAFSATLSRGHVVFFSRSKQRLWEKGETSGHFLLLKQIRADCDRDALLVTALPAGPVCHQGTDTCFGNGPHAAAERLAFMAVLEGVIGQRIAARTAGSYTAKLLDEGPKRIAQKVGEEGLEVALAAVAGTDDEVLSESADLLFHLLVLLRSRGLSFQDIVEVLRSRHTAKS